jgi:hypothetical protein
MTVGIRLPLGVTAVVSGFGQKGFKEGNILKRVLALVIALALMAPASAFADSSTCGSYNTPALCSVTASKTQNTTNATAASTLPFTGLDAILLAVGGATLLGAGAVVRVLSRRMD